MLQASSFSALNGLSSAPKALTALRSGGWLSPGALVSVEVAAKEDLDAPEGFTVLDERRYGAAKLVLLTT